MRRRSLAAVGTLSHNVMPHLPPSQMPMSKHRPHAQSDMKKEMNAPISNMAIHKMCALPKRVCNCCSPAYRCQITVWHEVKYDEKVRRRKEKTWGEDQRGISTAPINPGKIEVICTQMGNHRKMPCQSHPSRCLTGFLRYLCNLEHTTAPATVASWHISTPHHRCNKRPRPIADQTQL